MNERKTKLREAYLNLIGDYLLESISATMLKEELEELLDRDLSLEDFNHVIKENAKVYKVFLYKYRPADDYDMLLLNGRNVGEIGIELKEDSLYI